MNELFNLNDDEGKTSQDLAIDIFKAFQAGPDSVEQLYRDKPDMIRKEDYVKLRTESTVKAK